MGRIALFWNTLFAPRHWHACPGGAPNMRRWKSGQWEYRPMTSEEADETAWWFAIR